MIYTNIQHVNTTRGRMPVAITPQDDGHEGGCNQATCAP